MQIVTESVLLRDENGQIRDSIGCIPLERSVA